MKIHAVLFLLGAALVAVTSATSVAVPQLPVPSEEPECTGETEGDRWRQDCNWCRCRNGRGTCTRRLCMEGHRDDQPKCEGTPTWKDNCNTCSCVDGRAVCTSMNCDGPLGPETVTVGRGALLQCEEGSRWRVACNWCVCEEGRATCTKDACNDWSEAKAVEDGIVECHGESRWKKDCNWCTCVNGRGLCTTLACLPPERDPFHNLPEGATCVPGSRWKEECNWCNCGENGIAACTLRACIPGFKQEGPTCEEGSVWRNDECNTCRCVNGASACSKRLCRPQETRDSAAPQLPSEPQCQGEEEGARWRQDCNWCRCRDGVGACTKRLCPEGQEDEGPECEGTVSWMKDCNRCLCANGTAVCTSAFCGPLPVRPALHRGATKEPECQGEEEGDRWRQNCNWCRCRNGVGSCTKRLCPEGQEDEAPECEGNVSWKKDCNRCRCVNGNALCTSAFCGPLPARPAFRRGGVTREPECQGEEEGDRWRQDCNWCRCRNGVGACTKRLCPEGQGDDAPECEGNVSWKKDCNRCRCVNGNAVCTSAFCGPLPSRPVPHIEAQEPQCQGDADTDFWIKNCNRCRCRGGVPACTKRLCRPGEESRPICGGNPSWKEDCNHCQCNNGTAVCTSMHCGGPLGPQSTSFVEVSRAKTEEAVCVDGSRWRVDCNWCSCQGGMSACTEKGCLNLDALKGEPECEGNSTWKNDCNWCTCGDGMAVCTRMACLKETNDVCTEGTSWRENCNICRCSQGFVLCTKRACAKQGKGLECQGDSCGPRELPELCSLPPVQGLLECTGFFMKWTFSLAEGTCKQIVYGGCAGTANLFDSRAECEAACPAPVVTFSQTRSVITVAASSGGERCTLPKVEGHCFAAFQRYAYNAVTGACEMFIYGGCAGNANNFVTEEECVEACQGTQACDKSKCPWNLWGHYLAKECVPQYTEDACCPTSFQCPSASESGKDPTKCYYNGVAYNIGDRVPVDDPCSASCSCSESRLYDGPPEIECANVECPELFRPITPGCRPLYQADQCCPYEYDCVDPDAPPLESRAATCVWQNKTYLDGDKMYFDDHSCRSCICGPGFTGPNGPGCFKLDCGLTYRYTSEFHRGCSPVYFERDGCCPISWMCYDDSRIQPQQQQQQQQPGTVKESGVCRLGDKQFAIGEMMGMKDCKIECRCVTPPELTCIQYRSCEVAQEAAAQRDCPPLKCDAGCHLVVSGPGECPTCSCSPATFTCPAQTCPSTCRPEVDLQTGCPSCKCQCPTEVPCPNDCPVHTVLDETTGCPRCECQPGSPQIRSSCPEYPGGRVPCPQDCAVITTVDENGCERCVCDPTKTVNPFGPPLPPQNPACPTGPDGRAPCPMDCAVIRSVDENGCERCVCDPSKTVNPFGPPLPPQNPACRTGPDGRAPCPMDCAVIRSVDENGCEVCNCDPNNPGNPFGPFGPPPPPQDRVRRSCAGSGEAPCPMDCAIIRSVDENGCEVCRCDPNNPGNPFGLNVSPPKYSFYP